MSVASDSGTVLLVGDPGGGALAAHLREHLDAPVATTASWPSAAECRLAAVIVVDAATLLGRGGIRRLLMAPAVVAIGTVGADLEDERLFGLVDRYLRLPDGARAEDLEQAGAVAAVKEAMSSAEGTQWRDMWGLMKELSYEFDYGDQLEETLHETLAMLAESIGARRCLAVVSLGDDRCYLLSASDDPSVTGLPLTPKSLEEVDRVFAERRTLFIPKAAGTGRVMLYKTDIELATCGMILEPLLHGGTVYGALEVHLPPGHEPDRRMLELIRGVASICSPRIRSSDSYLSLGDRTLRWTLPEIQGDDYPPLLRKYREFFDRSSDSIVVLDDRQRVLHLNPVGEQLTGYAADGLWGEPFASLVDARDREQLAERLANEESWGQAFDLNLLTTSGDPIVASATVGSGVGDDDMLVLSFRDVTEARALSDELHHTKEFLERLIDSTVDGIVATDVHGHVVLFNQGAERAFGFRAEQVVGQMSLADLFPEGVATTLLEQLRGVADGGIGRLELVRKEIVSMDQEVIPVRLSASIIYEDGVEVGVVAIISDLRERLHIERRLVQAQEKLMETEKQALIAELAGSTAHELNQPLTSVMGYAELLSKRIDENDPNHRACLKIVQECERIAEIVRKIGKITRYETKAYVGETQILDLDKSSD